MKVALVYDRVNKWGGAERLLLTLHQMFPKAPLFTALYSPKKAPWAKVFPSVHTSFLQRIPFLNTKHEMLGSLMPIAFETFDFSDYNLVISITSEAAKGIITRPPTKHICICLTPTRYLWSGHDFYFRNPVLKFFSHPAVWYLKRWDKIAAERPDEIVAISNEVKKRIKKYYKRDARVIYPATGNLPTIKSPPSRTGGYYLIVSRLVPYKKVDLAIEAFNDLTLPLVVVGKGSQEGSLKRRANKNIKFFGEVDERKLSRYYLGAKALVMPQEEDFGIVSVEAQSFGVPVIAYAKGGARDTVVDGKTGIFFERQTKTELINAIRKFEKLNFKKESIVRNSQKFPLEVFEKEINELVNGIVK